VFIVSAMAKKQVWEYIGDYLDSEALEGGGEPTPEMMVCSPGEAVRNKDGVIIGCLGLDW